MSQGQIKVSLSFVCVRVEHSIEPHPSARWPMANNLVFYPCLLSSQRKKQTHIQRAHVYFFAFHLHHSLFFQLLLLSHHRKSHKHPFLVNWFYTATTLFLIGRENEYTSPLFFPPHLFPYFLFFSPKSDHENKIKNNVFVDEKKNNCSLVCLCLCFRMGLFGLVMRLVLSVSVSLFCLVLPLRPVMLLLHLQLLLLLLSKLEHMTKVFPHGASCFRDRGFIHPILPSGQHIAVIVSRGEKT